MTSLRIIFEKFAKESIGAYAKKTHVKNGKGLFNAMNISYDDNYNITLGPNCKSNIMQCLSSIYYKMWYFL